MSDKCLQFELWYECNSKCLYCYNNGSLDCTPDEIKLRNLQAIIDKISDLSIYKEYSKLSYLGGEFFQGQLRNPKVKAKFMELMDKTSWLLQNGYIKCVWLYATLTIGDQKDLYETLEKFKFKKEQFWILTSYDTIGRFHAPKMEETWKYHMKKLRELYPELLFNTTMILTGDTMKKYLSGEFSFKDFMKEYHTALFLKYPWLPGNFKSKVEFNKFLPDFFATRDLSLKFLTKFKQEEGPELWDKLYNFKYRAAVCMKNSNDDSKVMVSNVRDQEHSVEYEGDVSNADINKHCGHLLSCQCYVDSDACWACDKQQIEDLMKE